MELYINTSGHDELWIAIFDEQKVIKNKRISSKKKHSELLLSSIQKILTSADITLQDITGILVVKGPGSFTSLRIGITTANALAFGLGVPVLGIDVDFDFGNLEKIGLTSPKSKIFKPVIPKYGREPDIG